MKPTPQLLYEIRKFRREKVDCFFELFFYLLLSCLFHLLSTITSGYVSNLMLITQLLACIGIGANTGEIFALNRMIDENIAEYLTLRRDSMKPQPEKEDLS